LALLIVGHAATVSAASGPRALWHLSLPARGLPAHDAVSAYFLTQNHELVAASLTSGRVRWRLVLDRTSPTFGSRVIVHDETVVAGDYDLTGVDRRTGRRRWEFAAADGGGSGMHLGDAWRGLALSGSLSGVVRGIAMVDGAAKWTVPVGPAATTTVYAPVVSGDQAAVVFTRFGSSPVGGVAVIEPRTGRKRWQWAVPGSAGASGNPAFVDGMVFVASRDGRIHGFDAASGVPRGTLPAVRPDEQDYRPLAAAGRTLVAGSLTGEVVAWDARSRREIWRQRPSMASVAFNLSVQSGVVFVPYLSNQLIALRLRDGRELWRLGTPAAHYRWVPDVDRVLLLASGSRLISLFRHDGSGSWWR
jgi:hypothetical protein